MVRSKPPSKKQQNKGIDFKKIKRKLGRKLPPPKNATNTEIISKAIIIPEQSVASQKNGFSTSKKGLTLDELLCKTSHPNAKVRKNALDGIIDLFTNHPKELQTHKYGTIDKLKARISDDDNQVRDAFYKLFKTQIFPYCNEDNKGLMVSLLMPSIFVAMANSSIDVRLLAFGFLQLVVEYHPPTFSLYAEKILENYKDIIHKNHFYVQDKSKLKVALSGLAHCLSLLPCDESNSESRKKILLHNETLLAYEQDAAKECVRFANVSLRLKEIVGVLINCFQDFIPLIHAPRGFDATFDCINHILCSIGFAIKFSEEVTLLILDQDIASMLSKKLLGLFPLGPKNNLCGKKDEKYFILNSVLAQIFLEASERIHFPYELSNKYLEFIENTLLGKVTSSNRISKPTHEKSLLAILPFVPKLISKVDRSWRDNLIQAFTVTFNDCKPESSVKLACVSIVRDMLIPVSKFWFHMVSCLNIVIVYTHLKSRYVFLYYMQKGDMFFPNASDQTVNNYKSAWINKLASLLNHFGDKHPVSTKVVLQLLVDLGRVGCLKASSTFEQDIINFFNTCHGEEKLCLEIEKEKSCSTFKALTSLVCSCVSEMGDSSLVLHILEKALIEQIVLKTMLDNGYGILRMICALDSKPTGLSETSITALSEYLPGYLIDIVHCIQEDDENSYLYIQTCHYYLLPCFFLFDRSSKLAKQVMVRIRSMVGENTRALESDQDREMCRNSLGLIQCIVSVILVMHNDAKVRKIISSTSKSEIDLILEDVIALQISRSTILTVQGKHKLKIAGERLRIASNSLVI
ncbi:unnamed protein product [Cochlearia groenlandica]